MKGSVDSLACARRALLVEGGVGQQRGASGGTGDGGAPGRGGLQRATSLQPHELASARQHQQPMCPPGSVVGTGPLSNGTTASGMDPAVRSWESAHASSPSPRQQGAERSTPGTSTRHVPAPPPRCAGVPVSPASATAWPQMTTSLTCAATSATSAPNAGGGGVRGEDDGEIPEAALRRAMRALRIFFSGAQVRAIAAAPPSHYRNIPVMNVDPKKPSSALAQSLRLALRLLSQESPMGSRFRARLLLALASGEKEPSLCSPGGDPAKALSSSIEAQIFGMHGPPEDELAAFVAVAPPAPGQEQQLDQQLDGIDTASSLGGAMSQLSVSNLDGSTPVAGADQNGDIAHSCLASSASLRGLGASSSCGGGLSTSASSCATVEDIESSPSWHLEYEEALDGSQSLGAYDREFDDLNESRMSEDEFGRDERAERGACTGSGVGSALAGVVGRSSMAGETETDSQANAYNTSETSNHQARDTVLPPSLLRPPAAPTQHAPARPAGCTKGAAATEASDAGSVGTMAAAATAACAGRSSGGQITIGGCWSSPRRQNCEAQGQGNASPPRRDSRRVLPSWVDLKDAHSRDPSASRDDARGGSPPLAGGRAPSTPSRAVGPVAWARVQSKSSTSPVRDAHSPGLASEKPQRARRIVRGSSPLEDRVQHTQHSQQTLSGQRLPPTDGTLSTSSARPQNWSPPRVPGRSKDSPRTRTPQQAREVAGARTPRRGAPDRQGSTVRLRRDQKECQRAIAAQFSGREDRAGSLSPSRSRQTHALDFYALGKLIGKGAFGKVNVGVHKLTEELTAMKLCERKRIAEVQARKCLMQEVSVLKRLNGHPNIIHLFEVIETATHIVLVMEFAAGGDLLRYVRQRRRLEESIARELFKQLLDGIGHIHSMGVVHRDIKLENLLLDSYGCLKIADFGVAVVRSPGRRLSDYCGTPSYIAPEILLEAGYDGQPVDVWSAGIVLYAMLCGRVPFKGEHLSDLKRCILRGRFHVPSHLREAAVSMLKGIIVVDPRKRLTVSDALLHEWLEGVANRAEVLFGAVMPFHTLEGKRLLPQDPASKELMARVAEMGFPQAHVEESLQECRLNHATATFHLLNQQARRRRLGTASSQTASVAPPSQEGTQDDLLADNTN